MLLGVAMLNLVIIMAVCAHEGMPPISYLWLTGFLLYCVVRIVYWVRRLRQPHEYGNIARTLQITGVVSLLMMAALSTATVTAFVTDLIQSQLLFPMFLGFGTTAIAHCLYTLRPTAISMIVVGLFPSSLAMIWKGPFDAQMLGVSMVFLGFLMIRFVAKQYDQLVESLLLAEENRRLAHTDALTGLANRRATMAAIDEAIATDRHFGIALIDLDGFKLVNDMLGHHVGDYLLCEVADRLRGAAIAGDHVGRLGGDEFIALFHDVDGEADCSVRANTLLTALCRSVEIDGQRLKFGASLGFAVWGQHGLSIAELLHNADDALYDAKRTPAGRIPDKGRASRAAA